MVSLYPMEGNSIALPKDKHAMERFYPRKMLTKYESGN